MTAMEPIFEKYNVSAGFFGHDHNYQHYLKDGVHYFTTRQDLLIGLRCRLNRCSNSGA